jgi:predicted TPR repeat methyltransferase
MQPEPSSRASTGSAPEEDPACAAAPDPRAEPPDREIELTIPQALDVARDLLRQNQLQAAEKVYTTLLAHFPQQPDATHYLGVIRHRSGRREEGLQLVRNSLALAPGNAWMWNNLGNVLLEQQRADEAMAAYEECVTLDPAAADAWSNLGALHRKAGRLEESEDSCRRAVALKPDFALAWFNLAQVLIEQGLVHEGLVANSKAIVLAPKHQTGRQQVARALVTLGEIGRAAEVYREWLAEEPDNPVVLHHLAACEGNDRHGRAPDDYVETVFDGFATSFDAKLASLGYRAPQLIASLASKRLPPPARDLVLGDAGCGTGLCGPLMRDWAATLVGFDLSAGMLALAEQRGVYDRLHKAELVDYLRRNPQAFDLLISADTLCYFGDLREFAEAARTALRPGGRLMFTVEAVVDASVNADAEPFRLQPHGRYAHSRGYLGQVLGAAGFHVEDLLQDVLRREAGLAVQGWLVCALKPPDEVSIAG